MRQSIGIRITGESLPSGVYSTLENAKIVDSVVNSFNDVNLRWIARDVWTYSLQFDGELFVNYQRPSDEFLRRKK